MSRSIASCWRTTSLDRCSERGWRPNGEIMPAFICSTAVRSIRRVKAPPARCPVCEDERQHIPPEGQSWTTLQRLRISHHNGFRQYEPGLIGIRHHAEIRHRQRALLVCTAQGNILWIGISLIDDATVTLINGLGGLRAIAISTSALLHDAGRLEPGVRGCAGPSPRRRCEMGAAARSLHQVLARRELRTAEGVTLVRGGGHFPGGAMLHWAGRSRRQGVVCSADIAIREPGPQVLLVHAPAFRTLSRFPNKAFVPSRRRCCRWRSIGSTATTSSG